MCLCRQALAVGKAGEVAMHSHSATLEVPSECFSKILTLIQSANDGLNRTCTLALIVLKNDQALCG